MIILDRFGLAKIAIGQISYFWILSKKVGFAIANSKRKNQVESFKLRPFVEKSERKIIVGFAKVSLLDLKVGFELPFLVRFQFTSI